MGTLESKAFSQESASQKFDPQHELNLSMNFHQNLSNLKQMILFNHSFVKPNLTISPFYQDPQILSMNKQQLFLDNLFEEVYRFQSNLKAQKNQSKTEFEQSENQDMISNNSESYIRDEQNRESEIIELKKEQELLNQTSHFSFSNNEQLTDNDIEIENTQSNEKLQYIKEDNQGFKGFTPFSRNEESIQFISNPSSKQSLHQLDSYKLLNQHMKKKSQAEKDAKTSEKKPAIKFYGNLQQKSSKIEVNKSREMNSKKQISIESSRSGSSSKLLIKNSLIDSMNENRSSSVIKDIQKQIKFLKEKMEDRISPSYKNLPNMNNHQSQLINSPAIIQISLEKFKK